MPYVSIIVVDVIREFFMSKHEISTEAASVGLATTNLSEKQNRLNKY